MKLQFFVKLYYWLCISCLVAAVGCLVCMQIGWGMGFGWSALVWMLALRGAHRAEQLERQFVGRPECRHDWQSLGVPLAKDGRIITRWQCTKCPEISSYSEPEKRHGK